MRGDRYPRTTYGEDDKGNNLKELESINACGTYLGISRDTVRVRLREEKPIKFNSILVYVNKK